MGKAKEKVVAKAQAAPANDGFESVVENLPFWKFDEKPIFTGKFMRSLTLGTEKPFQVFVMAEYETGEEYFITSSYSIEKSIAATENPESYLFRIEFQGKTLVNGKPFNQFKIGRKHIG